MKNEQRIKTYLDYLYDLDYKERPPTVDQLMDDPKFFGSLTEEGRTVYPVWRETLKELYAEDSKYLVALTGAIGTGKSRTALRGLAMVMARILCLRNPWSFFNLEGGGRMSIVFFNLTKSLGESRGFGLLQTYLKSSSWFREKGILRGTYPNDWLEFPIFEYRIGSPYAQGFGALGTDVIAAIMDEVDAPNASQLQRDRVIKAYDATILRHESRFVINGESLGKFFLVSSKQEQLSFLDAFITEMKGSKNLYVKDIAIWEAKPLTDYSGVKFNVMLGDAYTSSKIIETEEEKQLAISSGFPVLQIPVEYKHDFERNINGALKDLAGVSVISLRRSKLFSTEMFLKECYDPTRKDPVKRLTVRIGLKDRVNLLDYFDLSHIRVPKGVGRYIHCDFAFSGDGDAMGLAMSCIGGWKTANIELEDGQFEKRKVPIIETDFAIRIKGKPGDQIPFTVIQKFVLDLKLMGFNIKKFTADHRAMSASTMQVLAARGIACDYLSVDRFPEAYTQFRDLAQDGLWSFYENKFLHFELVNLEYDKDKNKIDHPEKVVTIVYMKDGDAQEVVLKGSKDIADGVVGSVKSVIDDNDIPVDFERMRKAISSATRSTAAPTEENLWWLDRKASEEIEGQVEPRKTQNADVIKSIFKKLK